MTFDRGNHTLNRYEIWNDDNGTHNETFQLNYSIDNGRLKADDNNDTVWIEAPSINDDGLSTTFKRDKGKDGSIDESRQDQWYSSMPPDFPSSL